MTTRNVPRKLKLSVITSSKNQKPSSHLFIISKIKKCGNPEVAERVDVLNQSLQKVLCKETRMISIYFNGILFPQNLATNIFFGRDGIHLSFSGNKLITNVLHRHIGNNQAPATTKRTRPHYSNNGPFQSGPNYHRFIYWVQSFPQFAYNSRYGFKASDYN